MKARISNKRTEVSQIPIKNEKVYIEVDSDGWASWYKDFPYLDEFEAFIQRVTLLGIEQHSKSDHHDLYRHIYVEWGPGYIWITVDIDV